MEETKSIHLLAHYIASITGSTHPILSRSHDLRRNLEFFQLPPSTKMPSRPPSRGRSPTRSHTPTSVQRAPSPGFNRSRSRRRSPSPRSRSRSHSRSPPPRDTRNGHARGRSYSRSTSRSRSPSRGDRRSYRERSYSRSPSRESRRVQSSKIVVEKLTKNVTEAHLREIFGAYGRIESIDLPLNKQCTFDPECGKPVRA